MLQLDVGQNQPKDKTGTGAPRGGREKTNKENKNRSRNTREMVTPVVSKLERKLIIPSLPHQREGRGGEKTNLPKQLCMQNIHSPDGNLLPDHARDANLAGALGNHLDVNPSLGQRGKHPPSGSDHVLHVTANQ